MMSLPGQEVKIATKQQLQEELLTEEYKNQTVFETSEYVPTGESTCFGFRRSLGVYLEAAHGLSTDECMMALLWTQGGGIKRDEFDRKSDMKKLSGFSIQHVWSDREFGWSGQKMIDDGACETVSQEYDAFDDVQSIRKHGKFKIR
ncbi:hypothetical protein FQR65_LT08022 [Abscondita terminalis]|nr:hypothetical protein FQR65_LT08022 [Abscondita terminalis]